MSDVDAFARKCSLWNDDYLLEEFNKGAASFADKAYFTVIQGEVARRGLSSGRRSSDDGVSQYSNHEGGFSSIPAAAAAREGDADAYRATPQFPVSLGKLAVMDVCTLGVYDIYWAYQQWVAIRWREHEDLSPGWRAFFAPLWALDLFPRIQKLTEKYGVPNTFSPYGLALAFFLLNAAWLLPEPLRLIGFLRPLPILGIQHAVNRLNAAVAPETPRNSDLTAGNLAAIIPGAILLFFEVWGSLLRLR